MSFYACAPNSLAFENKQEWSGGVFTEFFLEGLQGKADSNDDRRVTFEEAANYARERTQECTQKEFTITRTPEAIGNLGKLVFADYSVKMK